MNKYSFEQNQMGTRVNITLYSGKRQPDLMEQVNRAFFVFRDLEEHFSIYSGKSEISFINHHCGKTVKTTVKMLAIVQYAIQLAEDTNGLFNPLVGFATLKNGRGKKIDAHSFREIKIDPQQSTIHIPAGTALDLNSIIKGLAIDGAMACLQEDNAMIEAGGDILVKGLPPGFDSWQIGIRNPQDPAKIITVIKLKSGAICTSGGYFRKQQAKEENRHHLVNPRNNQEQNIATSMTVIAPTAQQADALSTAAYFMGADEATAFIEKHPDASCLMIDLKNEIYMSPRMLRIFTNPQ